MFIEQSARWLRWLYPHALWRMSPDEHAVYLTFDDGPIPEATPFILDTLDKYGAKATFFVVGDNVRKYPELYEEVVRRGHLVGNHTYHHLGSFKHFTLTYAVDVTEANALIKSKFFRPPHGWLRHSVYRWVKRRYGTRRSPQRPQVRTQWVYHYVSRFVEEHRQASLRLAACFGVAETRRI